MNDQIMRLEAVGYNRGAAMAIIAKVARGDASIEQYEFAALDLNYVPRLNAEADANAEAASRAETARQRVVEGGSTDLQDYADMLGWEGEVDV